MGKFIKEMLDKVKVTTKIHSLAHAKQGTEMIYSTFFFAIDGLLSPKIEKVHLIAWNHWVIPALSPLYTEYIPQAKLIGKKKKLTEEDIKFVKELRIVFEKSFEDSFGKVVSEINKIDALTVKSNYKKYLKEKQGKFR